MSDLSKLRCDMTDFAGGLLSLYVVRCLHLFSFVKHVYKRNHYPERITSQIINHSFFFFFLLVFLSTCYDRFDNSQDVQMCNNKVLSNLIICVIDGAT